MIKTLIKPLPINATVYRQHQYNIYKCQIAIAASFLFLFETRQEENKKLEDRRKQLTAIRPHLKQDKLCADDFPMCFTKFCNL